MDESKTRAERIALKVRKKMLAVRHAAFCVHRLPSVKAVGEPLTT